MFDFAKNISPAEWAIIALILIVFFGRKTIIGLGRTGGKTLKEIKEIKKGFTESIEDSKPQKK